MPSTSIDNCAIYYEVHGEGIPVVITGGAHESAERSRELAEKLSKKYRVILWDRASIGCSDIQFSGARDLELWATQLAKLLHLLDAAPAYLVGPSNGARVSMVTALRYPEVVKGMLLFLITGGSERAARNLSALFIETANAASAGGMRAVAALEFWAQRVQQNPANRGRLLGMSAVEVERTLRRWAAAFNPSDTIMGLTDIDLSRIEAPARVIDATEPTHEFKRANAQLAALLPNAELVRDEEFQEQWNQLFRKLGKYQGHYTEPTSLARLIDEFVGDFETKAHDERK